MGIVYGRNERMEMERSALFFDLDGTILSEITRKIPESALKALGRARDRGHLLFLNTGRPYCELPPEALEAPFDGFLCGCGTYLTYKGEVLFRKSLSKERGDRFLDLMEDCGIDGICEGAEEIYFPAKSSRFPQLEYVRGRFAARGLGCRSFQEKRDFTYDKLFVFTDEKSDWPRLLAELEKDMDVIDRENGQYEIVPRGYSKATACAWALERFGIPRERCYVFGDSSNDLAMFRFAPHGIVMKKHSPLLEPFAEYVTETVEADGIARALAFYGFCG